MSKELKKAISSAKKLNKMLEENPKTAKLLRKALREFDKKQETRKISKEPKQLSIFDVK